MTLLRLKNAYDSMQNYIQKEMELAPVDYEESKEHITKIINMMDACGAIEATINEAMAKEILPLMSVKKALDSEYEFITHKLSGMYHINYPVNKPDDDSDPAVKLKQFLLKKKEAIYSKSLEIEEAIYDKEMETDVTLDPSLETVLCTYFK